MVEPRCRFALYDFKPCFPQTLKFLIEYAATLVHIVTEIYRMYSCIVHIELKNDLHRQKWICQINILRRVNGGGSELGSG